MEKEKSTPSLSREGRGGSLLYPQYREMGTKEANEETGYYL